MKQQSKSFASNLKKSLIDFFKGAAIKAALKALLGSATAGGIKGWIIKYVVTELFEEVAEPLIKLSIRKGLLVHDKIEGKIKIKKINKAKDENDADTYWDTISDI